MADLQIIITDAGLAAIVDAQNTGTLPVVISDVALGTGLWAPDATATALQAELKRINTVAGDAIAADTIHVTMTDASTDAYALGEFGLITDGGVLFAIYSDVNGITDKAAGAALLMAYDVLLTSVPPGSVTVGGTGFHNPPASETLAGVAPLATQELADAGADDVSIMTPLKTKTAGAAYTYTADQALATPANTGTIAQLFSWVAGLIKAITGKSDWKTAPATTLEAAATHAASSAPHSGHETPTGAQTKVDAHAALTNPHSASSSATANRLMLRDANGRAQVAAPSAAADIARKDTVDAVQTNLTAHQNDTGAHGAVSAATANTIMRRDASGRSKIAAPSAADDIARKDTVDTHAALTNPHSATSSATGNRLMLRDANGRAQVAAPSAAADIARKDTVDAVQTDLNTHKGATGAAHGVATTGVNGFMSSTDKARLDGLYLPLYGRITYDGFAVVLPAGWAVSKVATGQYRITHPSNVGGVNVLPFGIRRSSVTAQAIVNVYTQVYDPIDTSAFDIVVTDAAAAPLDQEFGFFAIWN